MEMFQQELRSISLDHWTPGIRYNVRKRCLDVISLLAIADISAVKSSARTHIHSAILVIDTSNNAWYSQVNWLIVMPYLSMISSNVYHFIIIF